MSKCAYTPNHPHGIIPDATVRFVLGDNSIESMHNVAPTLLDLCDSCASYFRREVEPNPDNRTEIELVPTVTVNRERILA